jgi:hypothetical protein
MAEATRDSGSQAYAVRICPGCGGRDTIVFSRVTDTQADLLGRHAPIYGSLRKPVCSRCGRVFERDQAFKEEKRRL